MKWTTYQKEILSCQSLGDIIYRKMWHSEGKLGYGSKGNSEFYEINIAKDLPSSEIRDLVLLHEIGHIYFNHLDININEEIKNIKHLFEGLNKPFSLIRTYGGPCKFINLAMDLEVNSKVFTLQNLDTLDEFFKTFGKHMFTPTYYKLCLQDSFRDYYIPLILRLEDEEEQTTPSSCGDSGDIPFNLDKDSFEDPEIIEELEEENYSFVESKEEIDSYGDLGEIRERESLVYKESPEQRIYNFLSSILKKMSLEYERDVIGNYNRGIRRNEENLFYSSRRRKISKGRRKICFILDVSLSMNPSPLLNALTSLKRVINLAAPGSEIITWDTSLIQRFTLDEIPEEIRLGYNTEISSSLNWAKDNNFTDCILYSDLMTPIGSFKEASKSISNLYIIDVDSYEKKDALFKDIFKQCKGLLKIEKQD